MDAIQRFWEDLCQRFYNNFIADGRMGTFMEGFTNTIIITIFALLIGVLIGVILALIRVQHANTGKLKVLDKIAGLYITVIRGIPMVVQLMIMYFAVLASFKNGVIVAIIAFGINSGAYVAEIVRAGIMSIDKGQMEAGRSLGLKYGTAMRRIILPQAIKNILPALGNEFISLLKETSVVGYLPITDLTKAASMVRSRTADAVMTLGMIAIVYLLLVILLSKFMKILERRMAKSDRR